jgi:hypothetical protein
MILSHLEIIFAEEQTSVTIVHAPKFSLIISTLFSSLFIIIFKDDILIGNVSERHILSVRGSGWVGENSRRAVSP